jgi:hypothetical protein
MSLSLRKLSELSKTKSKERKSKANRRVVSKNLVELPVMRYEETVVFI